MTHDPQTMADTLRAYAENSLYSEVMKSGAKCIDEIRAERDEARAELARERQLADDCFKDRTEARAQLKAAQEQLNAVRIDYQMAEPLRCPECGYEEQLP